MGKCSEWVTINRGVPQGSVLGPLLFSIFVNDLFYADIESTICNYADDNQLVNESNSVDTLKVSLGKDAHRAISWFDNNHMDANPDKFQCISLDRFGWPPISISVDGNTIPSSDSIEVLGVTLDNSLQYTIHISILCSKASIQINAMKRIRKYLNTDCRIAMYKSFISSNFSYCPVSWMFCRKRNSDKLEKLQEWALLFVFSDYTRPYTVYPKKYAHGFVVLCFVVVMQSFIMNSHEVFIHVHQGCFAGTGAIVRLPQCQWSKPDEYGKISQCITTTKHSKAKTVCIFLGIYCSDLLRHGNFLSLSALRIRYLAIEMFKYVHGLNPPYLNELLINNDTPYNLPESNRLQQPEYHTVRYGFKSFRYYGLKLWNALPTEVKQSENLYHFKKNITDWCVSGKCDMFIIQWYMWYIAFYTKFICIILSVFICRSTYVQLSSTCRFQVLLAQVCNFVSICTFSFSMCFYFRFYVCVCVYCCIKMYICMRVFIVGQ